MFPVSIILVFFFPKLINTLVVQDLQQTNFNT